MEKIGRFKVVGKLGRGAFGMVYKGHDPVINRYAAIKVMSEATVGDAELVARFKREAEAAGQLNHRNIVTIYDLGEHNGLPYIAMEFLEGQDLDGFIKNKISMLLEKKIEIITQAAEALHHAHSKGIVHRDVKPQNIRMLQDGTIKIMDFGIAKMSSSDMTRTGQFMGTVNYMSPEQIKARKLDGRCDLFALGAVFYELLTYRKPFAGDSITAVIYKIVNEKPPPMQEIHGTSSEWLEGLVFKCLEKDVNKRFESCEVLAQALRSRQQVSVPMAEGDAVESTLNLARQTAEKGDLSTAIGKLDEILTKNPDNERVKKVKTGYELRFALQQADTLVKSGRLEQARDELRRAQKSDPLNETVQRRVKDVEARIRQVRASHLVEQAKTYVTERRFEPAVQNLEEALKLDPYDERAKQLLTRAKEEWAKAASAERLEAAKRAHQAGRLEEAIPLLRKALEVDPYNQNAKTLGQQIQAELNRERGQQALADALLNARAAYRKEDFQVAAKEIQRALGLDPRNQEALELQQQIKEEKVKADERKALLDSIARGDKLLKRSRFDEARLAYKKALKLDPEAIGAQQGIEAARRKLTDRAELGRKRAPVGLFAGLAVVLVAALLAVAYFVFWPSPAKRLLGRGGEAEQAGQVVEAKKLYLEAAEADGKASEQAEARTKLKGIAPQLVSAAHFSDAYEAYDYLVRRDSSDREVIDGFRDLAKAQTETADSALYPSAADAWKGYWERTDYDPVENYDDLDAYYQLARKLDEAAEEQTELKQRHKQYQLAYDIGDFVDDRDSSFAAFRFKDEVKRKRESALTQRKALARFDEDLKRLDKEARANEQQRNWENAKANYEEKLERIASIRANVMLASLVPNLEQLGERTRGSVDSMQARIQDQLEEMDRDEQISQALLTAQRFEGEENLEKALEQYGTVLRLDAGNAEARQRSNNLRETLAASTRLKGAAQTAAADGNYDEAVAKVAEASRLNPRDLSLQALQTEYESQRGAAAVAQEAAQLLVQADAQFAANQFDAAEQLYRQVLDKAPDDATRERTLRSLDQVVNKRTEAEVQAHLQASARYKGEGRWQQAKNELEKARKLNQTYPGLDELLSEVNRELNKERIATLRSEGDGLYQAGNLSAARKKYEQILELDSRDQPARARVDEIKNQAWLQGQLSAGNQALQGSNWSEAQRIADAILARDPRNQEAASIKERALSGLGDARAAAARREQERQRRQAIQTALQQAQQAMDGRRYDAAISAADSVLAQDPQNAQALAIKQRAGQMGQLPGWLSSARQAYEAGRTDEASGLLDQIARLDSNYPGVAELRQQIQSAPRAPAVSLAEVAKLAKRKSWRTDWAGAAAQLDAYYQAKPQGSSEANALAGSVYFNASIVAAEKGDCPTAKRYAQAAAGFPDPAPARLSNSGWFNTLQEFDDCNDPSLQSLVAQSKTALRNRPK